MKNRDEIYNEVIQDYSHLQYELEGDELQDKINEIVDEYVKEYILLGEIDEIFTEHYKKTTND
mgnify:FL=1|tara:strand:- start:143 stop:331 length:189 start_codon:yes stop_codon:yes gene_type:complete